MGPIPNGGIPVFDKPLVNGRIHNEVWMLDDTKMWIQTSSQRIIVQLHDVAIYPFDMTLAQQRKLNERFIFKNIKPFLQEEDGILTIVHRGGGMTGLVWSAYPLTPSPRYFEGPPLKKEPPPWWNALV
jgi:hypothetical protein